MSDFDLPTKPSKAKPSLEDKAIEAVSKDEATKEEASKSEEKPKYTEAELLAIFDELLFSGEYSETISIRGGKLNIVLRSRTSAEVEEISKIMDTTDVKLMSTLMEKRSLLNLYAALTHYQGRSLVGLKREEKEAFINKLASPIVGLLFVELAKFDAKVYAATKSGEENF